MNHDLHRVIFNPERGIWMAVQETATARRACATAAACGQARATHRLHPLVAALTLLLAAPLALAQIITDPTAPGRERPTVVNSANGTPTVHIQAPSAAGVSRNRYQHFDIGQHGERGAILNNSRTPVQTQVGGAVPGNPWLARGSARVIVNEVRSATQSRLSGALEVAGQRADVIVANPAGLVVNGLTLINAAGLTLAGGQPQYRADGSLESFRVERSSIRIEGRGLDATQTDYAQVLARAIALNAGVWAQDLRVVTGANHLPNEGAPPPHHFSVAPEAPEPPQFALDVAHLGGMYARKIMIVGTEAGFGVRNAGTISAASEHLTLSADGQLSNTGVIASQGVHADLQLTALGIDNSGTLSSQRDTVLVDGSGKTGNAGAVEARRQLLVQAGQLSNQETGRLSAERLNITAARLDNAGLIAQTGAQALDISSLAVSNTGVNAVLGTPVAQAAEPAQEPASATPFPALPRGSIHVSQRLQNTGQLLANGPTDVKAIHSFVNNAAAQLRTLHIEGLLDNRGGTLQLQQFSGAQTSVLNAAGALVTASDLRLVANHVDNTGGFIGTPQSLSASVGATVNNAGTLSAGKDLTLQGQTLESNRGAQLVSHAGKLRLMLTGALNNQQAQMAGHESLHIDTAALNNAGGILRTTAAGSPVHITSAAGIDNSAKGFIQSLGDLQLSAGDAPINNAGGVIDAQRDLQIQSRGPVANNQGHLQAGRALGVRDALVAAGAALGKATQTLSNQDGTLFSADSLVMENQGLTGAGRVDAFGDMALAFANDLTQQATIAANGSLQFKTEGRLINQGTMRGGTGAEAAAREIDNQRGAEISAGQNTTRLNASTITNRGLIDGTDTRLDAASVKNLGTGRIYGDHVSIAAQKLENRPEPGVDRKPVIAARQDLDLGVPNIINVDGATLQSLGDTRMGASLDGHRRATGQAQTLDNTAGHIDVQGDLHLDIAKVDNLNAGVATSPLADVAHKSGEDLIALDGKAPESAALYKELNDRYFVPYFVHQGRIYSEMGIPGHPSDGRMFKPAHIDRFPSIPRAAFIDPATSYKDGGHFPEDTLLYLEPAGSPRFAQFGVKVPENYIATAPEPMQYGGFRQDSGEIGWGSIAEMRAYEAAMGVYRQSIVAAKELHEKILETVKEDNRVLDSSRKYAHIVEVTQTIYRDKVVQTQPGRIEAGGSIIFTGKLNNIDSTVIAGQAIDGTRAEAPNNQAKRGNQRTVTHGTAFKYNWVHHGGTKDEQRRYPDGVAPYTHTALSTFELPTVVFKEYHPRTPAQAIDANANPGNPAQRPTPVVQQHATESGQLARTLEAGAALPQSSMYVVNPADAQRPLVAADPAFTHGQQWASSSQLLDALDPALLQKRLGDGFYEQQLIQQQLGQLTGRRFLGNYRSNDVQYQALLQSGTTFAKAHGLRPGVALSAAQMAKLTSDMVWLVEQNVTLPDGSVQAVLAPKLYVVARHGDLDAQGALLGADQIVFESDGDAYNSGTIAGRRLVKITAHDINHVAGNISGKAVGLEAKRDINVEGGTISATEALLAHAGRDIHAGSTTRSTPDGRNTDIDQVAAFVLLQDPDRGTATAARQDADGIAPVSGLHLSSGRDIDLQAARIQNQVQDSETSIHAERDVKLSTVTKAHDMRIVWDPKNHLFVSGAREVGTEIFTRGLTTILARNDISARAAQVQSTEHLHVQADGSVQLAAGGATRALDSASFHRRSGFLSSGSSASTHQTQATEAVPSDFGGKTVRIDAGRDIEVTGSNVHSEMSTLLIAQRNIRILAAPESSSQQSTQHSRRSGLFGSGGLGVTLGSQRQSSEQSLQRTGSAASTIGSLHGPVAIIAGQSYRQVGSHTWAPQGDVSVVAKDIKITGAPETEQGSSHTRLKQSGLSFSLSAPVIGMAQTATSLADAASNTSNTRMQALAAGAAALNVYSQRKALQALASGSVQDLGLGVDLSLGSSSSRSDSAHAISSMRQSQVLAGGNVNLIATGAGPQSTLLLQDTNVYAGKVATLQADHKIYLLTTPQTRSESSSNSSRSAGIHLSISPAGPAIGVSAHRGAGNTQSDERINRSTLVTAGERVHIQSGSDTVLRDAVVSGPRVTGSIGGKLILESLQDTSRFDGRQSNTSGSFAVGPGYAAGSAGYSNSRARGDFASVNQPSGIYAGDEGFDLNVKGSTDFKGGVIASTQAAIDNERNRLTTGTLTHSDIENRSEFKTSGIHLSAGLSANSQSQARSTGSDTVTDPARWSLQNQARPGAGGAAFGYSSDQGSERSITRSSISPGEITITNEAAQQALTGQTAAEAVAGINRDVRTGDQNQGLTKTWDGPQMLREQEANARIVAAFGQQASQAIGDYAKQQMALAQDLRRQAQQDPTRAIELTTQAQEIEKNWGSEGLRRVAAHGVIGALTGGIPGALGAVSGTLTAPVVADALRENDIPAPLVDALTTLASTAVGGITGHAAGAASAFNEVTGNYLLTWHMNILKNCLNGNTCKDDESKQKSLEQAENISQKLDQEMLEHCNKNFDSNSCKTTINLATEYVSMKDAWEIMDKDVSRSSQSLFDYLYNSHNSKERLAKYFNTATKRGNFYEASDNYEKKLGAGVNWFHAAEFTTRSPLTGLGGGGFFTSAAPFFIGNLGAPLYRWRDEGSSAVLTTGFENFKNLYNNKKTNPIEWDINTLKLEQSMLQPIHEKHLGSRRKLLNLINTITDSEKSISRILDEKQKIEGGIDVLDKNSRIKYGCKLLGYTEKQGCKP